tara:strand:- start:1839 stop:5891 length:4053 start_codon:yes stop_codon:yes gene_type:complete
MSFTKSFLIECSRQNAENVKITQRNTGKENASWVNRSSFNFQVGDKVSTENIIVHSIGASADSTIELSGENEDSTGLVDNVLGIEFSNYVCDNGYNTIHLPMFVPNIVGTSPYIGFHANSSGGAVTANNRDGQDMPGQATAIVSGFTTPSYSVKCDYGAPICTEHSWDFRYKSLEKPNGDSLPQYTDGFVGGNPKVARTLFGFKLRENGENYDSSVSGRKYTKLGLDYCGPYRRNSNVNEENASFYEATREDIPIFTTSIVLDIEAPIYESPATICNKINEAFHQTIPLDETPKTGVMPTSVEGDILPHTAGPLNTVIRANGKGYINTPNYTQDRVYQNKLWGNIAVEDINKWKAIHAMMRCTLAFDGKIHYYGSPDEFFFPRPVIYIDALGYRQNYKVRQQDAVQTDQVKGFFPRRLYEFKNNCKDLDGGADHNDISTSIAYSVIPKYFVISTNIQYTQKNINRIKKWFDAMKLYQGDFIDQTDINNDTQNWFVYSDIGSSMDGVNNKDAPADFDYGTNEQGEKYSYGKYSTDAAQKQKGEWYSPSYGLGQHIRKGRFNVRHDTAQANEYQYQQNYSGSIAMNPYECHLKVGDTYDFSCSPRSDFPEKGYLFYQYGESTADGYPSVNTTYKLTDITEGPPCLFKNNEQGDATLKLFVHKLEDMTKMRFTNARGTSIDGENGVEGFGEWRRNGLIDSTDFDTSLSDGYGIYGLDIIDDDAITDTYYDIEDMYMTGLFHNYPNEPVNTFRSYEYLFQWTKGTSDGVHTQDVNGGLNVMKWNDDNSKWEKSNDFYIYSVQNNNYKHASHNPNNYTYNGGDAIPTTDPKIFWFWKDGHNLGFVGELVRFSAAGDGLNSLKFTPIDDVSTKEIQDSVFGEQADITTITLVVNMLVTQTDEQGGGYNTYDLAPPAASKGIHLNNKFPTEKHENSEKCCCFVVASDSASFDGSKWTAENPTAMPNIYHGTPFGPSPSFMDSPVTYMINQERNDGNATDANDASQMQNYMMIGANDPTCQFDDSLSRAKFFNFHTQRVLGAREMPVETDGSGNTTISKNTLGNFVIKIADTTHYYQIVDNWTETYDSGNPGSSTATFKTAHPNIGLSTSVCGISIEKLYSQSKGDLKTDLDDMTQLTEDNFYNSLLYKLGFTYNQFFPDFGQPYNWFDPAVQGKNDSINRYKSSKPLSTNAALTISDSANLAIQDNTNVPQYDDSAKDVPTYQLGFAGGTGVSLDGTDSQAIIAENLPIKMDDAFYQVYSDIVPTNYKSQNQDLNIIGTCMKNYIEGDYIYGFASTYNTTVEFPLKISEITTEIRLPNGNLAPIDQKSTVIYKIQREMTMPDINEIAQDLKKNTKKK